MFLYLIFSYPTFIHHINVVNLIFGSAGGGGKPLLRLPSVVYFPRSAQVETQIITHTHKHIALCPPLRWRCAYITVLNVYLCICTICALHMQWCRKTWPQGPFHLLVSAPSFRSTGDSNSCPPDLEFGALTKWLASRMLVWVSAGFSTLVNN